MRTLLCLREAFSSVLVLLLLAQPGRAGEPVGFSATENTVQPTASTVANDSTNTPPIGEDPIASTESSEAGGGEDSLKDLLDMDIEQLSQVNVMETVEINDIVASLTVNTKSARPAAVTVITERDIARTPHRNLLDLINVYVPGAMTMCHGNGTRFGWRGIVSDRNFKYLLLVNGRCLNDRAIDGVKGEIDQWDLEDIHRIEVIRGPGSVTYGPGAIGGVINITTKTSKTFQGDRSGVIGEPMYGGVGAFVERGYLSQDEEYGFYGFASFQSTNGFTDPNYYQTDPDNPDNHYLGKRLDDDYGPQPFLGDALDRPQFKVHLDAHMTDAWRAWLRYTQSGQTNDALTLEPVADGVTSHQYTPYQSIVAVLQNTAEFDKSTSLVTRFSFDSQSHSLGKAANSLGNHDDPLNIYDTFGYSENEWFAQSIYRAEISDRVKYAIGGEASYETLRAAWGEDMTAFKIKESTYILNGPDSIYIGDGSNGTVDPSSKSVVYVGNGLEMSMFSLLGELNIELTDDMSIIGSVRTDKQRWTDWMTSPRIALLYQLNDTESLKYIVQQSVRMHPSAVLYLSSLSGGTKDPEKLTSCEVLYTYHPCEHRTYNANLFYNDLEIVGWNGTAIDNVGELETLGLELEALYEDDRVKYGVSHAFVKQLNFDFNDALETGSNRNGISFADYYYTTPPYITLTDQGNDMNNWANNQTKLFWTSRVNSRWSLHMNTIFRWGYPGYEDEVDMYEAAYAAVDTSTLTPTELDEFNQNYADFLNEAAALRDANAFGVDIRFNASATRHFRLFGSEAELTVYALNLINFTDNKLLSYSTGSKKYYPERIRFIEEPLSVGMQLSTKY